MQLRLLILESKKVLESKNQSTLGNSFNHFGNAALSSTHSQINQTKITTKFANCFQILLV
ncbi:hypothetical protein B0X70_04130 [Photorhabdus akhurstii]|uniref:Uncharacterized protein n=1 Tax=Photorhabdus akhurstii TaxID=171438 RepID=A0ABX8LQK9_9GAMM|nr:hypothetical protein B0X70_04130 [Photorhabdus akhurstii]